MAELTLKIEGMSCGHCVMTVKKALDHVQGLRSSHVEVGSATVVFDETKTSKDEISKTLEKVGYKVVT